MHDRNTSISWTTASDRTTTGRMVIGTWEQARQEERAAPQGARGGDHGSFQHVALGGGARPAEPSAAWLGQLLQRWHAADGLPGGRPQCLRGGSWFPDAAPQG